MHDFGLTSQNRLREEGPRTYSGGGEKCRVM